MQVAQIGRHRAPGGGGLRPLLPDPRQRLVHQLGRVLEAQGGRVDAQTQRVDWQPLRTPGRGAGICGDSSRQVHAASLAPFVGGDCSVGATGADIRSMAIAHSAIHLHSQMQHTPAAVLHERLQAWRGPRPGDAALRLKDPLVQGGTARALQQIDLAV